MYFKVTKEFLNERSDAFIREIFPLQHGEKADDKQQLISIVLKKQNAEIKRNLHLLLCSYCRQTGQVRTAIEDGIPKYCVLCGRCSPIISLDKNLQKAEILLELASLSRNVFTEEVRKVLLEQVIVVVVTGLEIMFREVYCLMQDHKHVIFGDTLFPKLYSESRNEFLNLGVTNSKFKKEFKYNIEEKIGETDFRYISSVYFKRHVIVHNASNIDIDYISQTGADKTLLNERLPLSTEDVRKAIYGARKIAGALQPLMYSSVLELFEKRSNLLLDLEKQKKRKPRPPELKARPKHTDNQQANAAPLRSGLTPNAAPGLGEGD